MVLSILFDVFSINYMSSTLCLIQTAKNKSAYSLVVASRPFFLGQVFP